MALKIAMVLLVCLAWASADPIRPEKPRRKHERIMDPSVCPSVDGQFPLYLKDSKECRKYYTCLGGIAYQRSCAIGECFDITQQKCILEVQPKPACGECSSTDAPATCKPDHNCVQIPDDPDGECPHPHDDSPCSEAHYLPHKDNCKYFYECVHNRPVQMCCPEGTCFDKVLNVCA